MLAGMTRMARFPLLSRLLLALALLALGGELAAPAFATALSAGRDMPCHEQMKARLCTERTRMWRPAANTVTAPRRNRRWAICAARWPASSSRRRGGADPVARAAPRGMGRPCSVRIDRARAADPGAAAANHLLKP